MAFYRKTNVQEMIPWTDDLPMELVSISESDKANGSPKDGDRIAFNPEDATDMWLVSEEYFQSNYIWVCVNYINSKE